MRRVILLAVVISFFGFSCEKPDQEGQRLVIAPLHTEGRWFKDSQGRVVIMRGINMQNSVKRAPHDYNITEEDFDIIYNWGFNVIRLLIIWEAIEPEPSVFKEEFFRKVDQMVDWAEERGIFVLLDMHQDLYGPAFGGDGAPVWASRTDIPFKWNDPWGLNYFSKAVIESYNNFWTNNELQEHFIQSWLKAVQRYNKRPHVIGYDLYNEPFFGSIPPWDFERYYLGPFQDKVALRIRRIDPDRIIFYEPFIFSSGGLVTFLPPPAIKTNVAIAPHFYDPVLGLVHQLPYDNNPSRIHNMMTLRDKECRGLGNIPWFLGEFGIGSGENSDQYIHDIYNALEKFMASGTYWDYGRNNYMAPLDPYGNERPRVNDMARPYPTRIAGEPISFSFNQNTKTFKLTYKNSPTATGPTEIFIPEARHYPSRFTVDSNDIYWRYDYDGRILKYYHDPNVYTHTITVRRRP